MLHVVIEEVVPETTRDKYTDFATLGFVIGFIIMMVLDVSLGRYVEKISVFTISQFFAASTYLW
jgi:hypothetical protein